MKGKPLKGQNEGNGVVKGNPLFKIIPESMDGEDFVAMGEESN